MPLLDPADQRPVHFVGIAGAGMSALAELLARRGARITGTDQNPGGAPDLALLGIAVTAHDTTPVAHARAVVYSSAIPQSHPELAAARALGIPLVRRAEALAEAVSGGTLVAIAGTHGKTTTTVMTTEALASAGRDPTGVVGGRVGSWGGNLRLGRHDCFVVEADEYDRSFLALTPSIATVLNVEADHLDIYRDLADISRAFETFLAPARVVVRCVDDAGAMALRVSPAQQVIGYSATGAGHAPSATSRHARLVARHVALTADGARYEAVYDGRAVADITLAVPGLHNVRNSLAALAAGIAMGCDAHAMAKGLAQFGGVERRFQRLGEARGITVVDDYAHHPTEVAATLTAARSAFPGRRLVVVFQPHLYSRTSDLHKDFATSLSLADVLLLCDIYGAREQPMPGVTSALIGDLVPSSTLKWRGARDEVLTPLRALLRDGDVLVTMGAGDVTKTGPEVLAALRA